MSVLSRLLDKTSATCGIRRETLARGVVGAVTTLYIIKLTYPYIIKVKQQIGKDSKNNKSVEIINNNKQWNSNSFKPNKPKQIGLDLKFARQLIQLLKIMIPGWRSKEAGLLYCATITLLARTFLSVYVATLEGQIVKRIVLKDVKQFILYLARWFAIAFPATFVNSAIRYLEGRLALAFRERLVQYAYKMYLSQQTYYRVSALDNRLGGAEQRLTDDLSELASSVAHLYSHLTKPLLDCSLVGFTLISFSSKMGSNTIPGPMLAAAVVAVTGQVLRLASPRFGQLVTEEASRRGRLREAHARISAHAEEIAFYGGHNTEHRYLNTAYRSLVVHLRKVLALKLWYIMLEQFLMKYVWSGTGLLMIAMPLLYTNSKASSSSIRGDSDGAVSERTRYITTSKNLLVSGADAVERLMSSYKELVALAGYVNRVSEMFDVFKDAALCKYQRTVVASQQTRGANDSITPSPERILEFEDGVPMIKGIVRESLDGSIALNDVPIVTPNCEVIVTSLTLQIKPGDHLLITGPNGCGKSSLFRVISGLWPVYGGILTRPSDTWSKKTGRPAMFYIPQKPYMTVGCLREQITYPADSQNAEYTDEQLLALLDLVDLRSLAERETGGLDAMGDWDSTLSGGEKQRLAMSRLFYHAPHYALLDECTSAVSLEVEGSMYETAKQKGITLLTITHRISSLSKYHRYVLRFDGEGGWTFGLLDPNDPSLLTPMNGDIEKDQEAHNHKLKDIRELVGEDTQQYNGIS